MVVALVVGLLSGFFLGRAQDRDVDRASDDPTRSTPTDDGSITTRPPGDTVPQESPDEPTTSAPGTELAPSTIGSLDNPIPAGQAYVLGRYEIEVLDATRDADSLLTDHDSTNPPPPSGSQHVLVEVSVRFEDADRLGNPGSIPFFVSDGSNRWSSHDASCGTIPEDLGRVGFIEPGDDVTGQVCFTVPEEAVDNLVFATEGFAGPLYFALPD